MNALSNIPEGYTDEGIREGTEYIRRVVYTCSNCAGPICEGERYFDAGEEQYCEDCLSIMSAEEILGILGVPMETAGEYEEGYDI